MNFTYLRVSSNQQVDDSYSIDNQLQLCIKTLIDKGCLASNFSASEADFTKDALRVSSRGVTSYRANLGDLVVYADEGKSGKLSPSRRPALKAMIEEIVSTDGDKALAVWEVSRLSRDTASGAVVLSEILKSGCKFFSHSEGFNTDEPAGKLMLDQMLAFSEFYSSSLGKKIAETHRYVREKGGCFGMIPYGWKVDKNKNMVPDSGEQQIIKYVQELRSQGLSLRKIGQELRIAGITTRKGGEIWYPKEVNRLANLKEYGGVFEPNGRF